MLRDALLVAVCVLAFLACGGPPEPPPPCEPNGARMCLTVDKGGEQCAYPVAGGAPDGFRITNRSPSKAISLSYRLYVKRSDGSSSPVTGIRTAIVQPDTIFSVPITEGPSLESFCPKQASPTTPVIHRELVVESACFVGEPCANAKFEPAGTPVAEVEGGDCRDVCLRNPGAPWCGDISALMPPGSKDALLDIGSALLGTTPTTVSFTPYLAALGANTACGHESASVPGIPSTLLSTGLGCVVDTAPPGLAFPGRNGATYDHIWLRVPTLLEGAITESRASGKTALTVAFAWRDERSIVLESRLKFSDGSPDELIRDIVQSVTFLGNRDGTTGYASRVVLEGVRSACFSVER
jgi:hypothetical protein